MFLKRLTQLKPFFHRSFNTKKASPLLTKKRTVLITTSVTLEDLSSQMNVNIHTLLKAFREIEDDTTLEPESFVNTETAEILAHEFNCLPTFPANELKFPLRPPVVTIMGHVDHGKTTLLDSFRNSNIVATEHGGITQSIGAFSMQTTNGGVITFIDTPGHKAFTNMRARGAEITDIVILVICATEGVQPTTIESIRHANEADVPIIVAFNKIDLPSADINKIELQLLDLGLELEKFGGEVMSVPVSAKKKLNLDQLEEAILFKAELMDLRADTQCTARGTVIESKVVDGKGSLCSVLIQKGTLRPGDNLVAGSVFGKIRFILNEFGKPLKDAGPSQAVEITGLKDLPEAGDDLLIVNSQSKARSISNRRKSEKEILKAKEQEEKMIDSFIMPQLDQKDRMALRSQRTDLIVDKLKFDLELIRSGKKTIEDLPSFDKIRKAVANGASLESQVERIENLFTKKEEKSLNIILKAQNFGMLEALEDSVNLASREKSCPISIVLSGVGQITLQDIDFAREHSAIVLCMDLKIQKVIMQKALKASVPVKSHKIIYHLLNDVNHLIADFTEPEFSESTIGKAEVKNVFEISEKGIKAKVYGIYVIDGTIQRKQKFKVFRDNKTEYNDLEAESLRRFKEHVKEVLKGHECGLGFGNDVELQVGDVLICYEVKKRKRLFNPTQTEVEASEVQDK